MPSVASQASCASAPSVKVTLHEGRGSFAPTQPVAASGNASAYGMYGLRSMTGRAVDEIEIADVEHEAFDALEAHRAHADRVRAMRRPRGEYASFPVAARRQHLRARSALGLVEPEEHPDAIETVEVVERMLVLGEHLDAALDALGALGHRLARSLGLLAEGRADEADGSHDEVHHGAAHSIGRSILARRRSKAGQATCAALGALRNRRLRRESFRGGRTVKS